MISQITKIYTLIDRKTRKGLVGLFALMVISALLEMIGISLFIPLLQTISSPTTLDQSQVIGYLSDQLGIVQAEQLITVFCIGFALFFVFKGLVMGVIIYAQNKFVTKHQALFSQNLLETYLNQNYEFHLQRNSMELIRNITLLSVRVFIKGLLPLLQIVMELLVIIGIAIILLSIQPMATLLMGGILGVSVFGFYFLVRNGVLNWGKNTVRLEGEILIWANQALGSIKETKVYGHEEFFTRSFNNPTNQRASYLAKSTTAPHLPKLFVEAIAISFMAFGVALLARDPSTSIQSLLPTLGLFAVSAMRLMPSLSKIANAFTTFRENTAAVDTLYHANESLYKTKPTEPSSSFQGPAKPITFDKELRLSNVSYSYPKSPIPLFKNLDLSIKQGTSVAFVGASGAGKTTLIDLMLGLLSPSEGDVLIDGSSIKNQTKSWQSLIGYIPQDVYIIDDTLRRNVALGQRDTEIDDDRLRRALSNAQLDGVVQELPKGFDTVLGESGSRLSGGQRQRIGIARALYHEPKVLVMDEATSALDGETESQITMAIQNMKGDKTFLIIAHRLSTVRHCDKIVMMEAGQIIDTGTFEELEARNRQFKKLVSLASMALEDTPLAP